MRGIIVVAVAGIVACSRVNASPDDDSATVPQFLRDYCAGLAHCCEHADVDACAKSLEVLTANLDRTTFNPTVGARCLAKLALEPTKSCAAEGYVSPCHLILSRTAGATLTLGTKQPGDRCNDDDECDEPVGTLASCSTSYVCTRSFIPAQASGEPCDTRNSPAILRNRCDEVSYCSYRDLEPVGVCKPRSSRSCDDEGCLGGVGAPCATDNDCVGYCRDGACAAVRATPVPFRALCPNMP